MILFELRMPTQYSIGEIRVFCRHHVVSGSSLWKCYFR